jgi:hypothetical protein
VNENLSDQSLDTARQADAPNGHPAASVSVDGATDQPVRAAIHSDPSMALVLVVFAALGVVGFALYVVQLAIKRGSGKDRRAG